MFGLFALIGRADDAFDAALHERKWTTFIKIWLTTTIVVTLLTILFIFVGGVLSVAILSVFKSVAISSLLSPLWDFSLGFGAATAAAGLISAPLIAVIKEFAGHIKPQA